MSNGLDTDKALCFVGAGLDYQQTTTVDKELNRHTLLFSGEIPEPSARLLLCVCEERRHKGDYSTRFGHDRLSLLCSQIR